ncbi:MAG TPA: hypothetical protein PK821_06685 [Victivallales bacterium]|nr:hypothetical protein [Victivallales bacterium]
MFRCHFKVCLSVELVWKCRGCGKPASPRLGDLRAPDGRTFDQKIADLKSQCRADISRHKQWGNEQLAKKGLPPYWNPSEFHQLDASDKFDSESPVKSPRREPEEKKSEDPSFDFSF